MRRQAPDRVSHVEIPVQQASADPLRRTISAQPPGSASTAANKADDAGRAPGAPGQRSGDIAQGAGDRWQALLSACSTRLRFITEERSIASPGMRAAGDPFEDALLACTAELDQLHKALGLESTRRQELERELQDVRVALAQARVELAGTRAGERHARHMARHDCLTSLPNRSFFLERLEDAIPHALARRHWLAVLYLDVDGFKLVNDMHGHGVGDRLLKIVAARLTRAVRAEDMVSRIGGDEFACLLTGLSSREQLSHLASKLCAAAALPLTSDKLTHAVRLSIGIALAPSDGTTGEALLQNADAAMYRAKREKLGHAFFDHGVEVCRN